MAKTLRIGLIGCGSMGRRHADAVGLTADLELRLFSDHDQARAEEFSGIYGGTAVAAAEALQSPETDAIIVGGGHNGLVCALGAGSRVAGQAPAIIT